MFTNTKLAKSVKLACAFSAASAALVAPNAAFSQEAEADESIEKISVTGSRIKRTDIEGANPVTVMDAIDIEKFGITSIGDVLQSIPAAGSSINTNNNNGGNGTTTVDIRGLGAGRTLVLVNGKRWSPGLGGAVDLNNIPSSIIERIEILKDGASAVYGSDAVAGVVNIITRSDFEGFHASAYQGQYLSYNDGNKEQYDVGFGFSGDRGSVYMNISYVEEEPTLAGDRAIAAQPVFGTAETFAGSSATPTGRFLYWNDDIFVNGTGDGAGGITDWLEPDSRFNYAPFNYLSTPQERTAIYTQARYELTDNITATATAFYNNRKSEQALAPTPLFFGGAFGDSGFTIAANNPYNPTGLELSTDVDGSDPSTAYLYLVGRRMLEAGYRSFNQNVDQVQFNGGLEGIIELGDTELYWDVGYSYADITQNTITDGLLNMNNVATAIGDVDTCYASDGCVPLDLFGGATGLGDGTITQEMLDYITFTAQDAAATSLESYQANITGELFELPAGYLAFAAGYEKRWQDGYDQPDALIAAGITSGNSRQPTSGSYSVEEVYLELAVPVLEGLPGVERLDLELATRYSDYSNFGDTTNSKIGVKWQVSEDLLLRGTWSEAFRAPSITELFRGQSDSYPGLTDPCNGGEDANPALVGCAGIPSTYVQPNSQIRITVGGNPDLVAEEAESTTLGLVYSPEFVEGLSFTFDLFDIEIDNAVSTVGAQTILNACAGDGVTLCSLIDRASTGAVLDLYNGFVNLGGQTTSGFDWEVAYTTETSVGDVRFQWDGTYIDERTTLVVDPVENTVTKFNDAGKAGDRDVVPRVRMNMSAIWNYEDWSATYLIRFIGHTTEDCDIDDGDYELDLCSTPYDVVDDNYENGELVSYNSFNELEDMAYHDVSVSYHMNDNLRFTVGMNNLWDTDPEVSYSTFANSFDPSMYEVPGRFGYARVNLTF